jgi:acyl carrier protein
MMDDRLKETIADDLNVDPQSLTSDTRLEDIETWDSVMVLSLMVILSERMGREITPREMMRLKTFGDIEKLVAS